MTHTRTSYPYEHLRNTEPVYHFDINEVTTSSLTEAPPPTESISPEAGPALALGGRGDGLGPRPEGGPRSSIYMYTIKNRDRKKGKEGEEMGLDVRSAHGLTTEKYHTRRFSFALGNCDSGLATHSCSSSLSTLLSCRLAGLPLQLAGADCSACSRRRLSLQVFINSNLYSIFTP